MLTVKVGSSTAESTTAEASASFTSAWAWAAPARRAVDRTAAALKRMMDNDLTSQSRDQCAIMD